MRKPTLVILFLATNTFFFGAMLRFPFLVVPLDAFREEEGRGGLWAFRAPWAICVKEGDGMWEFGFELVERRNCAVEISFLGEVLGASGCSPLMMIGWSKLGF